MWVCVYASVCECVCPDAHLTCFQGRPVLKRVPSDQRVDGVVVHGHTVSIVPQLPACTWKWQTERQTKRQRRLGVS